MSGEFRYERLSSALNIRLIHLKAGHEDDPLQIRLVETTLDLLPQYIALSYVWGSELAESCIWISKRIFRVRPVLYGALKNCRARGISVIWADAICIDQRDLQEKSIQVRLMTRVFSSAESVIFYLGEWQPNETRELERTFQFVLGSVYEERPNGNAGVHESESNTHDHRDWRPLLKLLAHPWFTRVWTVQESVVAQRGQYVCGKWQIDQCALVRVIRHLWKTPNMLFRIDNSGDVTKPIAAMLRCMAISHCQVGTVNTARLREHRNMLGRALPIFEVMIRFSTAAALDPRDHLYALIGISQEASEKALESDYTRSCDVVFFDLAKYQVERGRGLDLLYTACLANDGRSLPSWVPRWDRSLPYPLLYTRGEGFRFSNIFSASAASRSTPSLAGNSSRLLNVHANIVDRISSLGIIREGRRSAIRDTVSIARELVDYVAEVLRTLKTCQRTGSGESELRTSMRVAFCDGWQRLEKATPKSLLDGLRFLVAETLEYLQMPTGQHELISPIIAMQDPALSECCKDGMKNLSLILEALHRNGTPPVKEEALRQHAAELRDSFDLNYPRGRVGRTMEERICYMPNDSLIGDRIAIIKGCEVPMVLRGQGKNYCIVGPCYVDGIMYGEIWEDDADLEEIKLA